MADNLIHTGTLSWWDGSGKTLCGLKIRKPERLWFPSLSGGKRCPACAALRTAKRG